MFAFCGGVCMLCSDVLVHAYFQALPKLTFSTALHQGTQKTANINILQPSTILIIRDSLATAYPKSVNVLPPSANFLANIKNEHQSVLKCTVRYPSSHFERKSKFPREMVKNHELNATRLYSSIAATCSKISIAQPWSSAPRKALKKQHCNRAPRCFQIHAKIRSPYQTQGKKYLSHNVN